MTNGIWSSGQFCSKVLTHLESETADHFAPLAPVFMQKLEYGPLNDELCYAMQMQNKLSTRRPTPDPTPPRAGHA